MKLIDKDAVVAEIEKRIFSLESIGSENYLHDNYPVQYAMLVTLKSLRFSIDTLEVKEVDLEEDINDFINEEYHYTEYDGKWIDEKDWRDSIERCAKHFFELGLKAQKL